MSGYYEITFELSRITLQFNPKNKPGRQPDSASYNRYEKHPLENNILSDYHCESQRETSQSPPEKAAAEKPQYGHGGQHTD